MLSLVHLFANKTVRKRSRRALGEYTYSEGIIFFVNIFFFISTHLKLFSLASLHYTRCVFRFLQRTIVIYDNGLLYDRLNQHVYSI